MDYRVKLQVNFILLALINFLLSWVPTNFLRILLLRMLGLQISPKAVISPKIKIFSLIGTLKIEDFTFIGRNVLLDNRRGLEIGSNCSISSGTKFYTLSHNLKDGKRQTSGKKIIVEDDVTIFSNAVILPGVCLGKNSAIANSAVVSKDVVENTLVAGNPAIVINTVTPKTVTNDYNFWFSL